MDAADVDVGTERDTVIIERPTVDVDMPEDTIEGDTLVADLDDESGGLR